MAPVEASITTPAGKAGEIVKTIGLAPFVADTIVNGVTAVPCVIALEVKFRVSVGGKVPFMLNVAVAFTPLASVTFTV